jgi:D-serine deaminase-like pyridoxal phosphate-dependent protein
VVRLVRAVEEAELQFRGLHYYDGQYGGIDEPERTATAHAGYDRLLKLAIAIRDSGMSVPEVITAGTPAFPCSLAYKGFHGADFIHRVSPGTIVYCDATSLAQLPAEYGYAPAALVLTRVVSRPRDGIITCDAGHKAVSAGETSGPQTGEALYLLPRHICPTVNNFDSALLVRDGQIATLEKVTARGREAPLLSTLALAKSSMGLAATEPV